jgi:hypothetical protein
VGDDEPFDPERMLEEHRVRMEEARQQMARVFGRRPEGEEHTAVVDHEQLAAVDPNDAHEWHQLFGYLGLDQLDRADPALPEPLRALLAVREPLPVGAWFQALIRTVTRFEPMPTAISRRDEALHRLREAPFVLTIGGKLVENVPTVSWLTARQAELAEADDRCERRIDEIEKLVARMKDLSDRLGQGGADPQREALQKLERDERALLKRVRALRETVKARLTDLSASLDKVRAAAELAVLRERSAQILGQEGVDAAAKVGADLEIEFADLRRDVDALRADLADEEARWKAVAEVAGVR